MDNSDNVVPLDNELNETFKVAKKPHNVSFGKGKLSFHPDKKPNQNRDILSADIISADVPSPVKGTYTLQIQYIQKSSKAIWKVGHLLLQHTTETVCSRWKTSIDEELSKLENRPKRLLILINPVSGKGSGRQDYEKKAAPIFEQAKIKTDVIVTTHGNHISEVLLSYDLSSIDGIIVGGGDGTYTLAVNAYLQRHAKENALDLNDPTSSIPPLPLKIGVLPSGTGQGMSKYATGTVDYVTGYFAGASKGVEMLAAYNDGKLVSYGSMMLCGGLFGDAIKISEANRQQGGRRYPYAMAQALWKNRLVHADVFVLPKDGDTENPSDWKEVKGPFKLMNAFLSDMDLRHNTFVYAEGLILALIKDVGRMAMMNSLRKVLLSTNRNFDPNKIEVHKPLLAAKFVFEPSVKLEEEILNIDGEPNGITHATLEIRFRPGMTRIFGAGAPTSDDTKSSEASGGE